MITSGNLVVTLYTVPSALSGGRGGGKQPSIPIQELKVYALRTPRPPTIVLCLQTSMTLGQDALGFS